MDNVFVGLDIGTCNVRVCIGEVNEKNELEIIGVGSAPSTGLNKGVIVNIEATMKAVKDAIEKAEHMAGMEVHSCYSAIGGNQVASLESQGLVAITGRGKDNREITQSDVDRVIESARYVTIPIDRQIIHVLPQMYKIDGVQQTKDPIDIIGVRLEVDVLIVTAMLTTMQNIYKCAARSGYQIDGVMLKSLACAEAVLTEEEKDLGSILIDLGGGTTDIIVVADGAPILTESIPIGGNIVTSDIAQVEGLSLETAENIKVKNGCCWRPLVSETEDIVVAGVGGRPPESILRTEICDIMQSRVEEILEFVREKVISKINGRKLSGNIVLVGGGAQMSGIIELTSMVFGMNAVRIGIPVKRGSAIEEYRSADYATAAGLVLASYEQKMNKFSVDGDDEHSAKKRNVKEDIKNFFREFF